MNPLRRDAQRIFQAALKAADPYEAILRHCVLDGDTLRIGRARYDLRRSERILVIGAGKASARMAQAAEKLLGKRIAAGLVTTKYGHGAKLRRIRVHECSHPVPDEAGVAGAREVLALARSAGQRDLVLCLISGGASALLPLPAEGLTLADKQATTGLLLASGANIHEMNCVRKHLSAVKGGRLAQACWPAQVVTLIVSDVIGDDLSVIGSGPTAPDPSTFAAALDVIAKFDLTGRLPRPVLQHLQAGSDETPKPDDRVFTRVRNVLVGSNRLALDAAARQAKALGYQPLVLGSTVDGETREVARVHAALLREVRQSGQPAKPPACLLSGGETTVTLGTSPGRGGRNQEFALALALGIAGWENVGALCAGTDGTDGPTDAAGAWADGTTVQRGPGAADHLARHDAYPYFERLGDLIKTGPTGTNVMDLQILLAR